MGSPARLADDTAQGKTTISAAVVPKIAGIAAREITGRLRDGRRRVPRVRRARDRIRAGHRGVDIVGVPVEVGEKQAAVDLDIIAEYGDPLRIWRGRCDAT